MFHVLVEMITPGIAVICFALDLLTKFRVVPVDLLRILGEVIFSNAVLRCTVSITDSATMCGMIEVAFSIEWLTPPPLHSLHYSL
jgi:hypothetical protein